jgi:hypothetical protein
MSGSDCFLYRRSRKSSDVFRIYSSGNLPLLEKCHYVSGMSSLPVKVSASEDCVRSGGGEAGLSCKVRGFKNMISSCHCCVSFYVEWFGLILHHRLYFASS